MDLRGQRRNVDGGVVERRQRGTDGVRRDRGKVALQVDHDLGLATGIDRSHGLMDPVGAGGMIGTGHHHLAAGGFHGGRDLGRVGGDRHPADFGLLGPPQHVDDHRQPADVEQRLAGQAGRRHAGGN